MNEPNVLDMAQLKAEMRQMYANIGFEGSLQVLYEMLIAARVLSEIMLEEKDRRC